MFRIGAAFACAEVVMNLAGAMGALLLGRLIGPVAAYVGFGALIALGAYMMKESRSELSAASKLDLSRGSGLALAAISVSLDSLGVGFSILFIGVPLIEALTIIGVVSIAATMLGLTIGARIGARAEQSAALLGGLLLFLTGLTLFVLKALHGS
jgi:manganese efflux pump family protein